MLGLGAVIVGAALTAPSPAAEAQAPSPTTSAASDEQGPAVAFEPAGRTPPETNPHVGRRKPSEPAGPNPDSPFAILANLKLR